MIPRQPLVLVRLLAARGRHRRGTMVGGGVGGGEEGGGGAGGMEATPGVDVTDVVG